MSIVFITIHLDDLVADHKEETNRVMRLVSHLGNNERLISAKLKIINGKRPLLGKLCTKIELLKELFYLKFKIANMDDKLKENAILINL
jgi:hypothetical protein